MTVTSGRLLPELSLDEIQDRVRSLVREKPYPDTWTQAERDRAHLMAEVNWMARFISGGVSVTLPKKPVPRRPPPSLAPTGDICRTCGGCNLVRTGACLTCQDCGTNEGCG